MADDLDPAWALSCSACLPTPTAAPTLRIEHPTIPVGGTYVIPDVGFASFTPSASPGPSPTATLTRTPTPGASATPTVLTLTPSGTPFPTSTVAAGYLYRESFNSFGPYYVAATNGWAGSIEGSDGQPAPSLVSNGLVFGPNNQALMQMSITFPADVTVYAISFAYKSSIVFSGNPHIYQSGTSGLLAQNHPSWAAGSGSWGSYYNVQTISNVRYVYIDLEMQGAGSGLPILRLDEVSIYFQWTVAPTNTITPTVTVTPTVTPSAAPTTGPTIDPFTFTSTPTPVDGILAGVPADCRTPVYADHSPAITLAFEFVGRACYRLFPQIDNDVVFSLHVPALDFCFDFYDIPFTVLGFVIDIQTFVVIALAFFLVRWGLNN